MIRFDQVTKVYTRGARPALDDVSIEIVRGEFVFLVGASGSGKSTFLRLALREERPNAGKVYIAGRDLSRLSSWKVPTLRRNIGMVFQDFRLLANKTVYENVAFALEVIGKRRHYIKTEVPAVLELVGLAGLEKRMPHELSGGEQQRVAIARAFVNRPPILLADEPTGNLDPATSKDIMDLLERINRTGTTVVMATHDSSIVDQMRQRVIELSGGKVLRDEKRSGYTQAIPVVTAAVQGDDTSAPVEQPVVAAAPVAEPVVAPATPNVPTRASIREALTGAVPVVAPAAVAVTAASNTAAADAPIAATAVEQDAVEHGDADEIAVDQPAVEPAPEPEPIPVKPAAPAAYGRPQPYGPPTGALPAADADDVVRQILAEQEANQ